MRLGQKKFKKDVYSPVGCVTIDLYHLIDKTNRRTK
nr:hypothetical protein NICP_246 [Escherichia phage vB_Eco_NicPhage]